MISTVDLLLLIKGKDEASGELKKVSDSAGGLGKVLGNVGTIAAGFLAAGAVSAGVSKLTGFMGDSVAAVRESIQVNAQLDAVLKSTGGQAGVTANQVRDMAGGMEKLSLFEDEAIISSSNLLLTFTKVGKDVFPAAQQSILDMSQALGTDLQSATTMVGKALNDPIGGITAMSRAGIQFTDDQKDMIKGMVEAGDTAGAQAIILKELETQFGGSAKAASDAAGAGERYKDRMNDLKEEIGAKLLPVQEKFKEVQLALVSVLASAVIPAIEKLANFVGPILSAAFAGIQAIIPKVIGMFSALAGIWKHAGEDGVDTFDGTTGALRTFFNVAMEAFLWIQANVPKVIALVLQKFGDLKTYFDSDMRPALQNIATAAQAVVQVIIDNWPTIMKVVGPIMNQWISIVETAVGIIGNVLAIIIDLIQGDFSGAWKNVQDLIRIVWDFIVNTVKNSTALLEAVLDLAWQGIKATAGLAWDGIKALIGLAWEEIKASANNGINQVERFVSDGWESVRRTVSDKASDIKGALLWPFEQARDTVGGVVDGLSGNIRGGLNAVIGTIESFVNSFGGGVNWIAEKLGMGSLIPFFSLPRLASGGKVRQGGLAIVGEEGAEVVKLPAGAQVMPNKQSLPLLRAISDGLAIGGPFGGLPSPGDIIDTVKGLPGDIKDGIKDLIAMGAGPLVNKAMDLFGVSLNLPGVFSGIGGAIFGKLKDALLDAVTGWLTGAEKALAQGTGRLMNPLPPGSYSVTQEFGFTDFAQSGAYGGAGHAGIDLAAPLGTPVFAADSGTVAMAGWNGGYGNYIRLIHNGLATAYGHLATILVAVNEIVEKGQKIGSVDSTGYSTGSHLHFETLDGGVLVNPRSYVQLRSGTPYVPSDGPYWLHEGEAVTPAGGNREVTVNVNGPVYMGNEPDAQRAFSSIGWGVMSAMRARGAA